MLIINLSLIIKKSIYVFPILLINPKNPTFENTPTFFEDIIFQNFMRAVKVQKHYGLSK